MENLKIACIGTGAMGGAILSSICKKYNPQNITVADKNTESAKNFAQKNNCNFKESNIDAIQNADFIILAVKPNVISIVLKEIQNYISEKTVVISMAAGISIQSLNSFAPNARFIRIMPNMPALVGQAMIALSCNDNISKDELNNAKTILESAGKVEQVEEKLMDCVTGVSGSGPAFVFMFIEALADAAVKCGMPRQQAYIYAAQTVKGSADVVLQTSRHPAELKDAVCSPGGTTIDGVAALENNNFRNAVIQAVEAAYKKSINLGK